MKINVGSSLDSELVENQKDQMCAINCSMNVRAANVGEKGWAQTE